MFDLKEFKKEVQGSDRAGLDYIHDRIIKDMKEKAYNNFVINRYDYYIREDYIIALFNAVSDLNRVVDIYEQGNIQNSFDVDYYYNLRDLLFKELGIKDAYGMEE